MSRDPVASVLSAASGVVPAAEPSASAGERLRLRLGLALDMLLFPVRLRREYGGRTRVYRAALASMLPTIQPGDRMLVLLKEHWQDRLPARGELVVFESWHEGEGAAMKRVIAGPGDEIALRGHTVYLDGEVLDEPYALPPTHGLVAPLRLGPDEYFLMGDNRGQSCDSRVHGAVPVDQLIGLVLYRAGPFSRIGAVK
jgi:signal peptidase I